MASPSGPRKDGVACDGIIKKGQRRGQECGMLLLAKDDPQDESPSIVCPRPQCGEHHSILALLRKAMERGDLNTEAVLTALGYSSSKQQRGEKETMDVKEKEFLDIAFGLSGTRGQRDALEIAVLLQKTLEALEERLGGGSNKHRIGNLLPNLFFEMKPSSEMSVRLRNAAFGRAALSDLAIEIRSGRGSSLFPLSVAPDLRDLHHVYREMLVYLNSAETDGYDHRRNFLRSAITMLPSEVESEIHKAKANRSLHPACSL